MSGKQSVKWYIYLPPLLVALSVAAALYLQNMAGSENFKNYRESGLSIMGTLGQFAVSCPQSAHEKAADAVLQAYREAKKIEKLMNRYNPVSDISRINSAPAGEWVRVDPLTWQALTESLRYNIVSGGAFDPGIGELMQVYKFSRKNENALPPAEKIEAAHKAGGIDKLEFKREGMMVRRKNDRVQIDLGGIAKGMGVDLAVEKLVRLGFENCFVEIGGEVRTNGLDMETGQLVNKKNGVPWRISIQDPRKTKMADTFEATGSMAVATSGDYQKFFEYQGKKYSHIINPATGHPVTGGVVSASVISPVSCMQADALATTACVLGEEKFRAVLKYFPGVRAILILEDGTEVKIDKSPAPASSEEIAAPSSNPE